MTEKKEKLIVDGTYKLIKGYKKDSLVRIKDELDEHRDDILKRISEEFKRRIDFCSMSTIDKEIALDLLEKIIKSEIDGD